MFNFFKRYFPFIFFILFVILFSLINREEFIQNYEYKIGNINNDIKLEKKISDFKLEKLKDIKNIAFYYTPHDKVLNKIINKIKNSKNRVYIEVYMLTETRIKNALVKAHNRGVITKVILEKNPYKAININNKIFKFLDNLGIDIVWSNPDLYALNHSKFIIIDNLLIVSSGNFTYSTFVFNRDLFLFIGDKNILNDFLKIFKLDFTQNKGVIYNDNLVLSPNYSRNKFIALFNHANITIDMYFQYLQDSQLEKLLIKKAKTGIKIRVVVSEKFYDSEKEKIKYLEKNSILIKPLLRTKMHSKSILIDSKYLFIGSVNFSSYSLDKNREIGLIFTNKNIIRKFSKLFEKDFAK